VVVVLAVLFVSYASSLRAYIAQRSHNEELEAQIASDQHAIANLKQEQRRWNDEAYIEAQARERFGWVLPGEVGLRVIGSDGRPLDASSQLTDPSTLGKDPDAQWWSTTVASIRGAGEREEDRAAPARRLGPRPRHDDQDRQGGRESQQQGGGRAR
jgi:hypothetical protein